MKLKYLLTCLLCSCFYFASYGQNQLDSLKAVFESDTADTVRLIACKQLVKGYVNIDTILASHYIQEGLQLAASLQDKKSELLLSLQQVVLLKKGGLHNKAIAHLQPILAESELQGFSAITATCFTNLGIIYLGKADYAKALSYVIKALNIYKSLNDRGKTAKVLQITGVIYQTQLNHTEALSFYAKSLKIYEELGDKKGMSANLVNMGYAHSSQGNYAEALSLLGKSLKIYEELGDKKGMSANLVNMGVIHHKQNDYAKALSFYRESRKIDEELGDKKGMSVTSLNMGLIRHTQGDYAEALLLYEESLKIDEELGDKRRVSVILTNIGLIYCDQKKYPEAINTHKRALEIRKDLKINPHIANSLFNIGDSFLQQNQEDSAFHYLDQCFAICKETGLMKKLREYFQRVGDWYTRRGQLTKALDFHYDALEMSEAIKDTLGVANVYISIADVHRIQHNFTETLTYQEKALKKYQALAHLSRIAGTKNEMANVLIETGDYKQALTYSLQAFDGYQIIQDSCKFAISLLVIGKAYTSLQQPESALYRFEQAILFAKQCHNNTVLASIYIEVGKLYQGRKQADSAFQSYEKAFGYAEKSHNWETMKNVTKCLYPIYQQRGQFKKAFETLNLYLMNKDSLLNEGNTRRLVEKEMQYAYDKEQQVKILLQQKKEVQQEQILAEQRWLSYGFIGAFLAMIAIAIAIYRNYRNKQKANTLLEIQKTEISSKNKVLNEKQAVIVRKNEVLQQQKAELEELDHIKSRFFANISHELRTPLTLISSPLQRLLSQNQAELQPTTIETLHLMERNTRQLKSLVNNILDLSKLEADAIELQEEPVKITHLLKRIFSNFDSFAQHLGIDYTVTISEELAATWLLLDAAKVEKVLNNLLSNAIKHTPAGGKIELVIKKEANQLVLQVTDTGQGITQADLPQIFNRFFQSKQPDAPIQGGTGIGLALSKELTHLMGGNLAVTSQYGKGSTFTLTLAYQETEALNEIKTLDETDGEEISLVHLAISPVNSEEKQFKVLIVEDHPDMQRFVQSLLAQKYQTYLANNGKEALKVLETESSIDLIISDVMMPEMDGYALLQHLKNSEKYRAIPVIMLTALDNEDNKLQALTIGVDDYLTKPFSPEELLARVHNLLIRHEVRQQVHRDILEEDSNHSKEAFAPDIRADEGMAMRQTTEDWLNQVADVMQKELENSQFHLTDLADQFHLSERQFLRKMKKLTGLTPKKYQQEIALSHARNLLEKGAYQNISAISFSVGIKNVTRFNQLYEARFGKKPSEYFSI
jgi:signal transduction histidine kinase/DNA-binding response OmpR family regulator